MDREPLGARAAVPVPVVAVAKRARRSSPPPDRPPPRAPWWALGGLGAIAVLVGGVAMTHWLLSDSTEAEPEAAPVSASAPSDAGAPDAETPEVDSREERTAPPEQPSEVELAPSEPEPAARACPDRSGLWAGSWAATAQRGTWTAEFRQGQAEDGSPQLEGDIRVTGTTCGTGGHIVGRILEDCSVEFDPYRTGGCSVRYTATFDGEAMHGAMSARAFGMSDSGRWHGTRRGPVGEAPAVATE